MTFEEISLIINSLLCILSFLLAVISVVTVVVSLKQNGKLIKVSSEQLQEMQKERELSLQPVLSFINPRFVIEKPRLFYSPPENEFSIISRFRLRVDAKNISSAVAINIVCTGVGFLVGENNIMEEKPSSKKVNYLANNTEALDFMFLEKKSGMVFDILREENTLMFPQSQLEAVFMNTSGGAFRMIKRYIIYPGEEELNKIKKWHSIVSSAEIEYKEELRELRKKCQNNKSLFEGLADKIDKAGGEEKELCIDCIEMNEFFSYKPISIDDYNKIVKGKHFGTFVGNRNTHCLVKEIENDSSD